MAKNYPDYDTLREQYEAGNISAVDFVTQQSDEVSEDYGRFAMTRAFRPTRIPQPLPSWISVRSCLRRV